MQATKVVKHAAGKNTQTIAQAEENSSTYFIGMVRAIIYKAQKQLGLPSVREQGSLMCDV